MAEAQRLAPVPPIPPPGPILQRARYLHASLNGRRLRKPLSRVETYCLFIGHARGGGSLLGALLDAHPNAVIADEMDILAHIEAGYHRDALLARLLAISRQQASWRRTPPGRSRHLPFGIRDQWQGGFRDELRLVGSSRAGPTTRQLDSDPASMQLLVDTLHPTTLRAVQIVRSPYDAIGAMISRSDRSFDSAIERYFSNCAATARVAASLGPETVMLVRYEQLLRDRRRLLSCVLDHLGLSADPAYLAAAETVLGDPRLDRHQVGWTPSLVVEVRRRSADFPFLEGYAYESL